MIGKVGLTAWGPTSSLRLGSPPCRAEGGSVSREIVWIAETEQLRSELSQLGAETLSLDSEADSFHHYQEKLCLIQLSFGSRDLLVDPLAGVDLSILQPALADPSMRKILHGADYDLRLLDRDCGLEIYGLFDTMIASRLVGERAFGLAALLEKFVGVKLDKRFQRADWSLRPLTPEMKTYAVMDTRHLEELAGLLEARLRELGRLEWAAEEFRILEAVRWSVDRDPADAFLRVKGASRLDPRGLGVLRELFALRDAEASRRDVPPFRVFRNEVLIALSGRPPSAESDLKTVQGMPRTWLSGGRASRLVDAVRRGVELPDSELPARPERRGRRRDPEIESRIAGLAKARDRVAEDLGIETSVLAPRSLLEQILKSAVEGGDLGETPGIRRWQTDLLRPVLEL